MGKKLIMNQYREVTQLTLDGSDYPFQGDPFFSVIQDGGKIVGFEIVDIEYIDAGDIPDIGDVYDLDEAGIKNSTIKSIVLSLRDRFNNYDNSQQRKTA